MRTGQFRLIVLGAFVAAAASAVLISPSNAAVRKKTEPPTTAPTTAPATQPAGKGTKTQGDLAKETIAKQQGIAAALKEKGNVKPPKPGSLEDYQQQLSQCQVKLDAEKTRHDAAIVPLQKDLDAAKATNIKRSIDRAQKALDKENADNAGNVADLNKRMTAIQAKIDAMSKK